MSRRRDDDDDLDSDRGERKPTGPALSIVETRAEEKPEPEPDPDDRPVAEAKTNGNGNGASHGFAGLPAESPTPAGARLLATQMAVSGSSRAEIEARLRNGFAIKDTGAILDAILGPEA
jgi:hypothetical protein